MFLTLFNDRGFVGPVGLTHVAPAVLGVQALPDLLDRLLSMKKRIDLRDVLGEHVAVEVGRVTPR